MKDRIQKEKDFHNDRFANETRDSLNKYYSVSSLIDEYFHKVLFSTCKGKITLEYGCGLGDRSFILAKYSKEVYGIDIAEIAIIKATNEAKIKNLSNIIFKVMNAEALDFPDNYFDVVCGTSILHHLNLDSSFSELSRILKPGGKAFFIEPLGHNPLINIFRKFTSSLRTEDEHPLRLKDLKLFNKYFTNVNIKYYYLVSLFAIPFRKSKNFNTILNFLNRIDQILFKIDFLKIQAWQVVIEVGNSDT